MDEAKLEVEEIVNYCNFVPYSFKNNIYNFFTNLVRDPERYSRLGGRLPKGKVKVCQYYINICINNKIMRVSLMVKFKRCSSDWSSGYRKNAFGQSDCRRG